ncbi:hypothetical protein LCGC14_2968730 [marine sediment metagenome]|uniref:Uncharacterized protein n=1 Tax=marine sediment metagenome TaxID=412755 RepID=A0A0F8XXJ0_9ZZZZ
MPSALATQFSYFLGVNRGSLLKIFQTDSGSDSLNTQVVGPQTITLLPAPAAAVDLSFCDMTTAKVLALKTNGPVNVWINTDPLSDPITHVLNGPLLIVSDITRIALQNPGGLSDVEVEYTFAGV